MHLYSGQEAVSTGVIRLLRPDDHICSTYRDHVHALSKNVPAREIMAELFGKKTGICRGQGGSMHMFSKKHNLVRFLPQLCLIHSVCDWDLKVCSSSSFCRAVQREVHCQFKQKACSTVQNRYKEHC